MDRLLDLTIKRFFTIIYFYMVKDRYYVKVFKLGVGVVSIESYNQFNPALRAYNALKYT